MPTIGLLGDVMLGRSVGKHLRVAPAEELWSDELRSLCASLDLMICNLECCVSERGEPTSRIPGKPFFFRAPPPAIAVLEAINVRAVSLANNHALDYEEEALIDTWGLLWDRRVVAAGAGEGVDAARRPAVVEAGGHRVGLVCVSDHPREYAVRPGRNGIAHAALRRGVPDWLLDEVALLSERCEVTIVFPHWGPNMSTSPAAWQRRAAAALQGAGASLVAGHSAHVFHGVQWSERGAVLFDLGDALDDYRVDVVRRNDLGVLAIWRPGAEGGELELVGLKLEFCHTGLAAESDADWIALRLRCACEELGTRVDRVGEDRFRIRPR